MTPIEEHQNFVAMRRIGSGPAVMVKSVDASSGDVQLLAAEADADLEYVIKSYAQEAHGIPAWIAVSADWHPDLPDVQCWVTHVVQRDYVTFVVWTSSETNVTQVLPRTDHDEEVAAWLVDAMTTRIQVIAAMN